MRTKRGSTEGVKKHPFEIHDPTLISQEKLVVLGLVAVKHSLTNIHNGGKDLPIGALAVSKGRVIGKGLPRDVTESNPNLHAAYIALFDAKRLQEHTPVDTIVISIEPSWMTLQSLTESGDLKRVFYVSPRSTLVEAGLVRPLDVTAEEMNNIMGCPLKQISRIEDAALSFLNEAVFSCVVRDLESGVVVPNYERFIEITPIL
jgi:tRNA(Arg) A34 adenosine deaminase TadA